MKNLTILAILLVAQLYAVLAMEKTSEDYLRLRVKPNNNEIEVPQYYKKRVRLRCRADGRPRPTIKWYKNGVEMKENKQVTFHPWSIDLHDFNRQDSDIYKCEVSNYMRTLSHTFNVTVTEREEFTPDINRLRRKKVVEGETVQWNCVARSRGPLTYVWVKNRKQLKNTDHITIEGGTLTITNVTQKDAGHYVCLASSLIALRGTHVRLRVTPKEILTEQKPIEPLQ